MSEISKEECYKTCMKKINNKSLCKQFCDNYKTNLNDYDFNTALINFISKKEKIEEIKFSYKCYEKCKQILCDNKDCNECQIIKDKNFKQMDTSICDKEINDIIKLKYNYNKKYIKRCKYFNNESSCNNNFEQQFIDDIKSNIIIFNIFKENKIDPIKLTDEQINLIKQINNLKDELNEYYKDDELNLKIQEQFNIKTQDLNLLFKNIIKLLKLTLLNIENKYIPIPNYENITDITVKQTEISNVFENIKQVIIEKHLNNNYKLISLLLWLIDLYDNDNFNNNSNSLTEYYNFLYDIYIKIVSYDQTISINSLIQQTLLSEYNSFIKINDKKPNIDYFTISSEIEETVIKSNVMLSSYSFYNMFEKTCFFSCALQFLYYYSSFKSYLYNDEQVKENFDLQKDVNLNEIEQIISDNINNVKQDSSTISITNLQLNLKYIKDKLKFTIQNPKELFTINTEDYSVKVNDVNFKKITSLIILYIIRKLFNFMDKYISKEYNPIDLKSSDFENENNIRNKYIPLLRILIKKEYDKLYNEEFEKDEYLYKNEISSLKNSTDEELSIFLHINNNQEDSSEYITKILDQTRYNKSIEIYNELVYNNKENNYININNVKSVEQYFDIKLIECINLYGEGNIDINNLLASYFNGETQNNYRYKYNDVIKYIHLKYEPNINDLRFIINRNKNNGDKLYNEVNINDEIDLKNYMFNLSDTSKTKYKIKSVIIHSGPTPKSGHYIIYVKNNDEWFEYNDMNRNNKYIIVNKDQINLSNVYILHYEKIE